MKKIIGTIFFLGASALMISSCSNTQVGTATGAAAGAGLGYVATGGSALGTVVGAGAGGLIGNSIGQDQDRRAYYNSRQYPGYYAY